MDSTTLMVISSAIAGLASGITEQTFSAAGGVVEKMHNRNKPTAAAQMTANLTAFANELNAQIGRLAESAEVIASRVEQPAVVVQLQSALVSASQTDSHEVHTLLAGLVSQRLRVENDTTAARACHRACQVIADLTRVQLKMLGFLYTLGHMRVPLPLDLIKANGSDTYDSIPRELRHAHAVKWLRETFYPYMDMTYTHLDQMNLCAVGCLMSKESGPLSGSAVRNELQEATSADLNYDAFVSTQFGENLVLMYEVGGGPLTSVGSVLGMFVADHLANRPTDLTMWNG